MTDLAQAIGDRVDDGRSITFVGDETELVGRQELWDEAQRVAAALSSLGVGPGARVGLLASTGRRTAAALLGTWIAGAAASVLPPPYRVRDLAAYVEMTHRRLSALGASVVLLGPEYLPLEPEIAAAARAVAITDLTAGTAPSSVDSGPIDPEGLAIVQFSSGSTGEPRPLALSHRAVLANIGSVTARAGFGPHDTFASWLPLFHDMGLVGTFLVPLVTGAALASMDTGRFASQPHRWMRMLSDHHATICCGPNSAYSLAIRTLEKAGQLDLSHLRIAFNGAEPIQPDVVRGFTAAGARHGLDPKAIQSVYGMAEATLAIAFPPTRDGLHTHLVDRRALEVEDRIERSPGGEADARELVSVGTALPGMELRIGHVAGPSEDGVVGDLFFRGPSTFLGTLTDGTVQPRSGTDGWVDTGDVGAFIDGELVLCGRRKDILIVGGRNLHPDQVEHAVEQVDGVRLGNVAAFGVPHHGTEGLVVFAETRQPSNELRVEISSAAFATVGVYPVDVRLMEPGSLPKTSSGKVRRQAARWLYLDGVDA